MPKRKSNIGRHSNQAKYECMRRKKRTEEEHLRSNENSKDKMIQLCAEESREHRNHRLQADKVRHREQRQRQSLFTENRDAQLSAQQQRMRNHRMFQAASFNCIAFQYDPEIDYSSHSKVTIGDMNKVCQFCHALKFKNETPGMCCAAGKVVLPQLNSPPEPLHSLLMGETFKSKLFLQKIRKFNSCFRMTSFGVTKMIHNDDNLHFNTTFKIQGQVYHRIGSLFSMPNQDPKFLQVYFMGNEMEQVDIRCHNNHIEECTERDIVTSLQMMLNEKNQLIQLFKYASERMSSDDFMVVIKADKIPTDRHVGQFNVPTTDEVAIVMVGEVFEKRDIKIKRRDDTLQTIHDIHRSYDALQYPLIFWEGEDGYHINIQQRNPLTGVETNKTRSVTLCISKFIICVFFLCLHF